MKIELKSEEVFFVKPYFNWMNWKTKLMERNVSYRVYKIIREMIISFQ